jgi:predicted dehydrogenase
MLRVAIVGCGKIADDHLQQIRRIKGCEVVGVCDREPLMACQLAERFHIAGSYNDLDQLLRGSNPDVVHITTPPQSHFAIAHRCLEAGCHVYVEKPFTIDEEEAACLISFAEEKGLKLTAGHDGQFRHASRRMRALVRSGYIGGSPVHMESYYCYEIGRSAYASALLGDPNHWVRNLPGKLLHNIISHGIASIAEFLGDSPQVSAHGFVSPLLSSMGETEIIDELRITVRDEHDRTAYFTFSSQMRPALHCLRIYGNRNGLVVDHDLETVIKLRGTRYKSYVEKFVTPFVIAGGYVKNALTNARSFLFNDFHMKSGMKHLIESFYRSIVDNTPSPIPYREIILTARIMDAIFAQLSEAQSSEMSTVAARR